MAAWWDYHAGMKPHIHPRWRHMRRDDMIVGRLPLHRMQAIAKALRREGYRYAFAPCDGGYLVTCTASPLDVETQSALQVGEP